MNAHSRLAVGLLLGALAVGARAEPPAGLKESFTRLPRGLVVRVYDIGERVAALPEPAYGEKPNVARVVRALELRRAEDFGGPGENFVTEVVGWLFAEIPGQYAFQLVSDDGAKLWINDEIVVDHDGLHGPEPREGSIELRGGIHALRLLHFQAAGGAHLELHWRHPDAAPGSAFVPVPPDVLAHAAAESLETSPGRKRFIPPLRRGLPGDGTPVAGLHPGFTPAADPGPAPTGEYGYEAAFLVRRSDADGTAPRRLAWIPGPGGAQRFATPTFRLDVPPYSGDLVLAVGPEAYRVVLDRMDSVEQGCAFRFSVGERLPTAPTGKTPFEMRAVRALRNGLEIEFSRPLDPRCGWEPGSYSVEQWPLQSGGTIVRPPRRDGVGYAVKSACVSADRKRVFLEVPDLRPAHVVYLRLLTPCIGEDGERPWSTEAWYTLNAIPGDRVGQVLPRPPAPRQNVLTDAEREQGWRLLFDGETTAGWHTFKKSPTSNGAAGGSGLPGWSVLDGCLVRTGPGGDIVTDEEFDDFELKIEWRVCAGGNSGIFYRVSEADPFRWVWETGPEMQVLDNAEHVDGRSPLTSAGSNYALHAPPRDVTRPVGLFNEARIVVRGNHVEHWLNGERVVEYELGSTDWERRVAASKFSKMPHYGRIPRGRIALQDHGDRVWFRNVKLRAVR